MKNRLFVVQGHTARFSCMLILLLAVFLVFPSAEAGSLFSLAATPAPSAVPMVTPAATQYAQGLFSMLTTATPTPKPTPSPEPTAAPTADPADTISASERFQGLSYTDLTEKEADRVYENRANGTWEYVYEHVTGDDYQQYGTYLGNQGCTAESVKSDVKSAVACKVFSEDKSFIFQAVYQSGAQRLTLIYSEQKEPEATPQPTAAVSTPAPSAAPTAQREQRVCSHCDHGICRRCDGAGAFKCSFCGGMGVCPVCQDKEKRLPNYGGVGPSTYTKCSSCEGSGRCKKCGGERLIDCPDCDGGVCPYCHGDYFLDP